MGVKLSLSHYRNREHTMRESLREEVTGGWRKLCNRETDDFCSALVVIGEIISRRMTRAKHVARMST
jgi:hypothetical protein